MFIVRKKFKRKNRTAIFYYVMKNEKVNGKHRLKNVMYLGDVNKIMQAVEKYSKEYDLDNKKHIKEYKNI